MCSSIPDHSSLFWTRATVSTTGPQPILKESSHPSSLARQCCRSFAFCSGGSRKLSQQLLCCLKGESLRSGFLLPKKLIPSSACWLDSRMFRCHWPRLPGQIVRVESRMPGLHTRSRFPNLPSTPSAKDPALDSGDRELRPGRDPSIDERSNAFQAIFEPSVGFQLQITGFLG